MCIMCVNEYFAFIMWLYRIWLMKFKSHSVREYVEDVKRDQIVSPRLTHIIKKKKNKKFNQPMTAITTILSKPTEVRIINNESGKQISCRVTQLQH